MVPLLPPVALSREAQRLDADGNPPPVAEVISQALQADEVRAELAKLLMAHIWPALASTLGGSRAYVARSAVDALKGLDRMQQDEATSRFLRTATVDELARHYGVSRATMYRHLGRKKSRP